MTGNMIGRIFNNRYKITDRIGIGGMAEVYRAQDNVLGRIVAVKTMLPQYAADPNFTQRFKHEAASAANLQSPYIVNVYDWGQDEGTYYIVMEYVRGSDLKTAINERGAINQRKVAEIGSQVCHALSAAHNLDIIHRDIKPQNIMVQPDGNVKVMDFGIARAKNSVMTQTSSVLGTAHYISPEQAQGKELTPASDIYSLGVVLYEAATGKLPFDGPDAVSVAMKQVNDAPVPPSQINPEIDPDFEDIIMKALAKRPVERFATASDMRISLNDYLAGRPVNLGGTFGGAETAVMAGMAGAALAGAAGADGTAVMPAVNNTGNGSQSGAPTNYRAEDDKKKKGPNKKTIAIVVGIIVLLLIAGIAYGVISNSNTGDPVPDVTGQTVEVATQRLTDGGFELGRQDTAHSDTVESGKIISQDPRANSKVQKGTKINVVVSSGKERVTVPDLTNMTADQARQALDAFGLKGTAGTAEYSNEIALNHIIRQNPGASTEVNKGDTVTYFLSVGPGNIDVPNVAGSSRSSAIATLEADGFAVSEGATQFSDTVAEGVVISQNPSSGIKVARGSTITITVSKGAEPEPEPEPEPTVTVPRVVGSTISQAITQLQKDGFEVKYGGTDLNAKVKSQSPKEGSVVQKGSSVELTPEESSKKDSSQSS